MAKRWDNSTDMDRFSFIVGVTGYISGVAIQLPYKDYLRGVLSFCLLELR